MDGSINSIINASNALNERNISEPNAKILKIPKSLEVNPKPQKLSGNVVHQNNDGTLEVHTNKGRITIKPENLRLKIANGDKIELLINKGNPPSSAAISLPQKTYNVPPEIKIDSLNINLPPKLTIQEILNGEPIKAQLINPAINHILTQTHIVNITSNISLVSDISIISDTLSPLENLLIINSSEEIMPKLELLELPVISSNIEQITDFVKLKAAITRIPLGTVMAQVISNPNNLPITMDKISLETPIPSVFSEIKISEINPPFNKSEIQAGEIIVDIAGFTRDKHLPVIKTIGAEPQYYVLQTPIADIVIGTQLKINVSDIIQPNQNVIIAPAPNITSSVSLLTPEIWGIMQDIQSALNIINPQVAVNFNNIIPNAAKPAQLAPSALFFIAAMRSGDLQSWLGERTIDILKRSGKSDLLTKLSSETSNISRINSEINTQEWRSLTLPLAWQDEIHKAVIHYRKESNEDEYSDESTGEKTRFVVDLSLSKIGKTQLDGLFISNNNDKGRLDLILRTENNFSSAIKQEMISIYKDALNESNFIGELRFQGQAEKWVNITLDVKPEFSKEV